MSCLSGGDDNDTINTGTLVFYYIISFIHGAVCVGTVIIYNIETWSILRATLTHFFITLTSFYILGFLQGWLEFGSLGFFCITAGFVVAYFIIWFVNYISYKKAVNKLNEEIEFIKIQNDEKDEEIYGSSFSDRAGTDFVAEKWIK